MHPQESASAGNRCRKHEKKEQALLHERKRETDAKHASKRAEFESVRSSMLGLGEAIHTPNQRRFALSVAAVLALLALLAPLSGNAQGPRINAFLPIVATAWALADLMTAFLLLAQFYVNGTRFVAVLSVAYGMSGLLTIPYMLAFPGVLHTGPISVPDQQICLWLWLLWHWAFPAIVILSVLYDPYLRVRVMSPRWIRNVVWVTVAVTLGLAAASTAAIIAYRAELPQMVNGVHLSLAVNHVLAPSVAALNFIGCALLLRRGRRLTTLHLWICVAMFAAMLDGVLNGGSHSRFTYGWYIGKVLTVATASIVLTVLLSEVTGLYRRLAQMATIDPLTQLFNRRAFEDHLQLVANHAKRHSAGLGLLMLDVDHFKGYNDEYGHAEGDECLRRLATVFRSAATRPLDHVARFGGEEFVVLLPETSPEGAIIVAERIIERVEKAAIPYADCIVGYVTVSIGVGFAVDARELSTESLLDLADRALYDAKRRGRNRYTVSIMPADVKEHGAALLVNEKAS